MSQNYVCRLKTLLLSIKCQEDCIVVNFDVSRLCKDWVGRAPPRPNSFNLMQFWENLAKSYVGAPLAGLAPPPRRNPRSTTGVPWGFDIWTVFDDHCRFAVLFICEKLDYVTENNRQVFTTYARAVLHACVEGLNFIESTVTRNLKTLHYHSFSFSYFS